MEYIQVAVNVPNISGVFDYHLPPALEELVQPGCLVEVPFGRQSVQGIVLRHVAQPQVPETRPVSSLLDAIPAFTAAQLSLAEWMAAHTLTPISVCLDAMLPPGLSQQADTLYQLSSPPAVDTDALPPTQTRLLALLEKRGPLRGRQLDAAFVHVDWRTSMTGLVRRGHVQSSAILPPPSVRPKVVRMVQLTASPGEVQRALAKGLGKAGAGARRAAMLTFLSGEPYPVQAAWVYAASGGTLADLEALAVRGLVLLSESEVWRDPLDTLQVVPVDPPPLTPGQQAAWDSVQSALQQAAAGSPPPPYLLYGVTGAGKTEIYLRAVAEALALGKQALILVPEISLTPQAVHRFLARFPGQVGLLHSQLTPGERYDTWRRARSGALPVIIGPRSALFAPLPNLGVLILDECHDDSYYQSTGDPRYHAVDTALEYARLTGALILLGSATPSIVQMQRAQTQGWNILSLPERIMAHRQVLAAEFASVGHSMPDLPADGITTSLPLPPIQVVDMRVELKSGNSGMFSRELQSALSQVLAAGQQSILFLNRRGSATYVFCRDCGYTLRCPKCDRPLIYHTDQDRLQCHTCGYTRKLPATCPNCAGKHIRQFGAGTEKVEQEVRALLPEARVLRWDAETAAKRGAADLILGHFLNHRADVLVGTQMITKGLDLPLVTLVGAVLADVGLNLDDYHANERVFTLLSQVAGRAGRSPLGGRVILQTFHPENPVIQFAARHDYAGFYAWELENRRKLKYPPFYALVRVEFRDVDEAIVRQSAADFATQVQRWIAEGNHSATDLIGPVPCFFPREGGSYRWQVILRGPNPAALLSAHPTSEWKPRRAQIIVEVDPPSLL